MMVNMPVEAVNERCINCPELEVDIYTTEMYGTTFDEDGKPVEIRNYHNQMKCAHYARCKDLLNNIFIEKKPKAEETPKVEEPALKVVEKPKKAPVPKTVEKPKKTPVKRTKSKAVSASKTRS